MAKIHPGCKFAYLSRDYNGGVVFLFRGENKLKYVTVEELLEGIHMAVLLCVF